MEYIVIGLLIALLAVLFIKQPTKMYGILVKAVIANLSKNEAKIVQGLYNSLPKNIKDNLTSKQVATIVVYVLNVIVGILEDTLDESNK